MLSDPLLLSVDYLSTLRAGSSVVWLLLTTSSTKRGACLPLLLLIAVSVSVVEVQYFLPHDRTISNGVIMEEYRYLRL